MASVWFNLVLVKNRKIVQKRLLNSYNHNETIRYWSFKPQRKSKSQLDQMLVYILRTTLLCSIKKFIIHVKSFKVQTTFGTLCLFLAFKKHKYSWVTIVRIFYNLSNFIELVHGPSVQSEMSERVKIFCLKKIWNLRARRIAQFFSQSVFLSCWERNSGINFTIILWAALAPVDLCWS